MKTEDAIATPVQHKKQKIDRLQVVNLVRQWGDVNTDGILDPTSKFFVDPKIDGVIGYRLESSNAIVYGDPVCAAKDKAALATSFQNHCQSKKLGVVYTIASEEFAVWAEKHLLSALIEFGAKFVLDPHNIPTERTGSKAVLLRKKVKHAQQEGAVVEEYIGGDAHIEQSIEQVGQEWLKGRKGPQVYLAHVTLFKDRQGKRWFYAKKGERFVGILMLNELQSHQGWLLNNIMVTKDAPHGISELLVISTLKTLELENCRSVTIGPVPRKELGKISGLGTVTTFLTRWGYKFAKKVFHLNGHEIFWEKFQPEIKSSYLLFPKQNLSFSSVKALLKAFNVRI